MRFGRSFCWRGKIVFLLLFLPISCNCAWVFSTKSVHAKFSAKAVHSVTTGAYDEGTKEEKRIQNLWEANSFLAAKSIIDTSLANETEKLPLLSPFDVHSVSYSTPYEELFRPLYSNFSHDIERTVDLPSPRKHKNDKRRHFLLQIAYRGKDFCGWQRQNQGHQQLRPSVQQILEDWLAVLEKKKVNVRVCGRTDAGVSALGQVCRFRTFQDLKAIDVYAHLQKLPNHSIRTKQVRQVTSAFHPTFTATCRAYAYLIDINDSSHFEEEKVVLLNQMLQSLEGLELSYMGLSYGKLKSKTPLCTLHHARARLVRTNLNANKAICIELVGDRFLRRMVRSLVQISMSLAIKNADCSSLLRYIRENDSRPSCRPAPSDGLIFIGALFNAM